MGQCDDYIRCGGEFFTEEFINNDEKGPPPSPVIRFLFSGLKHVGGLVKVPGKNWVAGSAHEGTSWLPLQVSGRPALTGDEQECFPIFIQPKRPEESLALGVRHDETLRQLPFTFSAQARILLQQIGAHYRPAAIGSPIWAIDTIMKGDDLYILELQDPASTTGAAKCLFNCPASSVAEGVDIGGAIERGLLRREGLQLHLGDSMTGSNGSSPTLGYWPCWPHNVDRTVREIVTTSIGSMVDRSIDINHLIEIDLMVNHVIGSGVNDAVIDAVVATVEDMVNSSNEQ
jgi:hypothetical protein